MMFPFVFVLLIVFVSSSQHSVFSTVDLCTLWSKGVEFILIVVVVLNCLLVALEKELGVCLLDTSIFIADETEEAHDCDEEFHEIDFRFLG